MEYAGTNYPALTDTDTLYDLKAYSEALRTALMKPKDLGDANLNTILLVADYAQPKGSSVTVANNYPSGASVAGALIVKSFGNPSWLIQEYTQWASIRRWIRATNSGASGWGAWKEL